MNKLKAIISIILAKDYVVVCDKKDDTYTSIFAALTNQNKNATKALVEFGRSTKEFWHENQRTRTASSSQTIYLTTTH